MAALSDTPRPRPSPDPGREGATRKQTQGSTRSVPGRRLPVARGSAALSPRRRRGGPRSGCRSSRSSRSNSKAARASAAPAAPSPRPAPSGRQLPPGFSFDSSAPPPPGFTGREPLSRVQGAGDSAAPLLPRAVYLGIRLAANCCGFAVVFCGSFRHRDPVLSGYISQLLEESLGAIP